MPVYVCFYCIEHLMKYCKTYVWSVFFSSYPIFSVAVRNQSCDAFAFISIIFFSTHKWDIFHSLFHWRPFWTELHLTMQPVWNMAKTHRYSRIKIHCKQFVDTYNKTGFLTRQLYVPQYEGIPCTSSIWGISESDLLGQRRMLRTYWNATFIKHMTDLIWCKMSTIHWQL